MMMRSRLSLMKGRLKIPGDAAIEVGDIVALSGVGKRFSGKNLVTGVRQYNDSNGWVTDIQFGLSAKLFSSQPDVSATQAAGLLPGVNGLHLGVVAIRNENEKAKEPYKVKVKVPSIHPADGILWSRLATLSAGKETGTFFQPDPGDEVILGFLNDDPRQPVILGSVHSKANKSPLLPTLKNAEKGIFIKGGIRIVFDEDKKRLIIQTSDKNVITINDEDKTIHIKDVNNNSIELNSDGITLNSAKDVNIQAKGSIKLEADSIALKSEKDISINTIASIKVKAMKKVNIQGSSIDIT